MADFWIYMIMFIGLSLVTDIHIYIDRGYEE